MTHGVRALVPSQQKTREKEAQRAECPMQKAQEAAQGAGVGGSPSPAGEEAAGAGQEEKQEEDEDEEEEDSDDSEASVPKKKEKGKGAPTTPKALEQAVCVYRSILVNMSRSSKEAIVNVLSVLLVKETDTELKEFIQNQLHLIQDQGMTIPELRKALDTYA